MASDPATHPEHDLTTHPQDRPQPRVPLGTVLALLRVAAGRRGHAALLWHRYGFTYGITVRREDVTGGPVADWDPNALGGTDAVRMLLERLND